jgi:hypothetical protein
MAAIEGFSKEQNDTLATVEVGNLILINQLVPASYLDNDEDSDDDSDEDGEEDGEEDSHEDSEENSEEDSDNDGAESSGSESEVESGAVTSGVDQVLDTPSQAIDRFHAARDAGLASTGIAGPFTLMTIQDGHVVKSDERNRPLTVYLVVKVAKGAKGIIEDLSLVPLKYSTQAGTSAGTFHLYGKECVPSFFSAGKVDQPSQVGDEYISILDLPSVDSLVFNVSPDGDDVRRAVLNGECLACDGEGWVPCITQLSGMVKDYTIPTSEINEAAVCPSCIGINLMKEHQDLRAELEAFHRVSDFGAIHQFQGRLNTRRRVLHYDFEQFDERKWGYLFDDMLSDDGEAGGDRDDGRYEEWDEATDPNNGVVLRPASDATIKSLSVKKYAELKTDDEVQCAVCRDKFEDELLVMQLPCKHIFCEDTCTTMWLKQHDTCPICRARVPPVKVEKVKKEEKEMKDIGIRTGHEDVHIASTGTDAEQVHQEITYARVVETDRDDDVEMVDAW